MANATPLGDNVSNENDEITLYNTNPTVKDEQHTLNKNDMNETDIHKMNNIMDCIDTPGRMFQSWNILELLLIKSARRKSSHSLMKS